MKISTLVRIVALVAVVALAIPAVAKPVSKDITIGKAAKFGSTEVAAGQYRLLIDGTKVTVKQGNRVVAEVGGEWEQRDPKPQMTSVLIGTNGQVIEVRFAGDNRVLVIRGQ